MHLLPLFSDMRCFKWYYQSPVHFMVNLMAGLIAYVFLAQKPNTPLVNTNEYQKIVLC